MIDCGQRLRVGLRLCPGEINSDAAQIAIDGSDSRIPCSQRLHMMFHNAAVAARDRPCQGANRPQLEHIVESFAHQWLYHAQRVVASEAGSLIAENAGLQQRSQVIAHDHARCMVDRFIGNIDLRHMRARTLECRAQHRERFRIAFRSAISTAECLRCRRRICKASQWMDTCDKRTAVPRNSEIAGWRCAAAMKYNLSSLQNGT